MSSCGPDVKYGSADYVVDQYIEKHLKRNNSTGFLDITGYLDPEDYNPTTGFKKLTKAQNKRVLKAVNEYGYKAVIKPLIPKTEYDRICMYYLNYLYEGKLPSESNLSEAFEPYMLA